jgi:SET domain-containing protein
MKNTFRFKDFVNATTYKIDAEESDYLYSDESQIPDSGNGLFTAISIYKDEVISIFDGENISDKEAKIRATLGEDGYFVSLPDGTTMDSKHVFCFAKYANDASGMMKAKVKNNAIIALDEDGNVCLTASKNIRAGEEIFCNYGKAYWEKRGKK